MKTIVPRILAASALILAGCSMLAPSKVSLRNSEIESVLAQRAKLENEQVSFLHGARVAGLMAIDVRSCPPDFRAAWFDYLVQVQTLHTKAERVAGLASAVGKPATDLPSL